MSVVSRQPRDAHHRVSASWLTAKKAEVESSMKTYQERQSQLPHPEGLIYAYLTPDH